MFILINNRESLIHNITWVNKFEAELYIPNFPNENEREPFENIKQRILNNDYPTTTITLLIEDDKLIDEDFLEEEIVEYEKAHPEEVEKLKKEIEELENSKE